MEHEYRFNIKDEVWKDIPGFQGRYAVSNFGRVKRHAREVSYLDPRKNKQCIQHYEAMIMRPISVRTGRLLVGLIRDDGKPSNRTLHMLVAEAFVPNPEGYSHIKHIDGDLHNNAASNLQWDLIGDRISSNK